MPHRACGPWCAFPYFPKKGGTAAVRPIAGMLHTIPFLPKPFTNFSRRGKYPTGGEVLIHPTGGVGKPSPHQLDLTLQDSNRHRA